MHEGGVAQVIDRMCTDPDCGAMLHAYELGALSPNEAERFEIHLLGCTVCFEEVRQFSWQSEIIRSDHTLWEDSATGSSFPVSARGKFKKVLTLLWPDTPLLLRPAVSLILVLVMLLPALHGLRMLPGEQIRPAVAIALVPTRSAEQTQFAVPADRPTVVSFVYDGAVPGQPYTVEIRRSGDAAFMHRSTYNDFDQWETGRLLLPSGTLTPGVYQLTISDPSVAPPAGRQEYRFSVTQ